MADRVNQTFTPMTGSAGRLMTAAVIVFKTIAAASAFLIDTDADEITGSWIHTIRRFRDRSERRITLLSNSGFIDSGAGEGKESLRQ